MQPFAFDAAASVPDAVRLAGTAGANHEQAPAQFLAGGTTLLDLMKLDVMQPTRLVDVNPLAAVPGAAQIATTDHGLRIGALVRMATAAEHPAIMRDYPVIAQTLTQAASSQLRNMATLGGNMLQRTRCGYFRDTSYDACNKRTPGSGCAALDGFNRQHAVLGTSKDCIATYPGDFAQALIALDAALDVQGPRGVRSVPFAQLHRRPGDTPNVETNLASGELITAIVVPATAWARRSVYVKVRDRQSYEFALASAAVALDLRDGKVQSARIALGGVATVPWRAHEAEAALVGRAVDDASAQAAAEAAFAGAVTRADNAYKVPLGRETLKRALLAAAALEV